MVALGRPQGPPLQFDFFTAPAPALWQDLTLLGSPVYCVRASLNYVCKGYTKDEMVLVFRPLHRLLGRVDHFWKNRFE